MQEILSKLSTPLFGGIKPEELPPSEDIKKLERRVKVQEKKLASQAGKLPEPENGINAEGK